MALVLTPAAKRASESSNILPNLVLDIEGVPDKYGTVQILKYIKIGDPGLFIDGTWKIGGYAPLLDQETLVTFDGTSTSISQKLDIDKGSGASISQMSVALVDVDEKITQLITPGEVVTDMLGREATVWLGFSQNAFPEDYIRIFRGTIDEIGSTPGRVTFQISHPDQKKRQEIFIKAESKLNGAINPTQTTIALESTDNFLYPIMGPDGLFDTSIKYGIRIEDEIIFYTGISGNDLTGCARGSLGTAGSSHADQQDLESFCQITGNSMDLALKLMLSGWNGPYEESVVIQNFNILGDATVLPNSIFSLGYDVAAQYGVVAGDYITTTGASDGANNVALKQITEIVRTLEGSYIIVDGVSFVDEGSTTGVIDFRSRYDTFHPGAGLQMHNDEVDITEHERIKRFFLSSFEYDFYIRDNIKGKEFLEGEIYFPAAAYSIPRKAKSSIGYHIGPLPDSDIRAIDTSNVIAASKVSIKRSINRNFYNTVVYRYEEKVLEEDKFLRGYITTDGTSKTNIPVGTKPLVISSKGMREVLSGNTLSVNAANRRLKRYKYSAEYIEGIQITYGSSYNLEIGDIVLLDVGDLKMSDTKSGTRDGKPRLFEVYNKTFDIKTGKVSLSMLDTAYSTASRYCLMSPSSKILAGSTSTVLKLRVTGNSIFGPNEGAKWSRYLNAAVRVRSNDFTTRNDLSTIQSVSGNTITLSTPLSFTPAAEDTLTVGHYNDMVGDSGDRIKLIYAFQENTLFDDGTIRYQMV